MTLRKKSPPQTFPTAQSAGLPRRQLQPAKRPLAGAAWPFGILGFASGLTLVAAASAVSTDSETPCATSTETLAEQALEGWERFLGGSFIDPVVHGRTAGVMRPVAPPMPPEPTNPMTTVTVPTDTPPDQVGEPPQFAEPPPNIAPHGDPPRTAGAPPRLKQFAKPPPSNP